VEAQRGKRHETNGKKQRNASKRKTNGNRGDTVSLRRGMREGGQRATLKIRRSKKKRGGKEGKREECNQLENFALFHGGEGARKDVVSRSTIIATGCSRSRGETRSGVRGEKRSTCKCSKAGGPKQNEKGLLIRKSYETQGQGGKKDLRRRSSPMGAVR